jgi:hypothetical protein
VDRVFVSILLLYDFKRTFAHLLDDCWYGVRVEVDVWRGFLEAVLGQLREGDIDLDASNFVSWER